MNKVDNEIQNSEGWVCDSFIMSGVKRDIHCEIVILPGYIYCCFPWSLLAAIVHNRIYPFRITIYSNDNVSVKSTLNGGTYSTLALNLLHKELLNREPKLIYPISHQSAIVCIHGDGCLYFVAVNGTSDHYLSIKLFIEEQQGIIFIQGRNDDTYDIPPLRQQIISCVARDGRQKSIVSTLFVRYLSSMMTMRKEVPLALGLEKGFSTTGYEIQNSKILRFADAVELTFAGVLLVESIDMCEAQMARSVSVDIVAWIPPLGCSK
jgi:hypothetical protein